MSKCPHAHIQYCPLYVESHHARGMGCVDDVAKPCRVERDKMNYTGAIAALRVTDARLVARCEFAEMEMEHQEQRTRNMRLNGVH